MKSPLALFHLMKNCVCVPHVLCGQIQCKYCAHLLLLQQHINSTTNNLCLQIYVFERHGYVNTGKTCVFLAQEMLNVGLRCVADEME